MQVIYSTSTVDSSRHQWPIAVLYWSSANGARHLLISTLTDNGKCLGYRAESDAPYVWFSYEDIMTRSKNFGAGLLQIGGRAHCEYLVGIFAKSCVEWTVAEYGCLAYGMVTAPLYDSLGSEVFQETTEYCKSVGSKMLSIFGICCVDSEAPVVLVSCKKHS